MKKIFSFALVAVMVASMFSFVACKKQQNEQEPQPQPETPEVLTSTAWINNAGPDDVTTLIFNTVNEGVQQVHNSNGDFDNAFTYEYADGEGSFTLTLTQEMFQFTVEGNILYLQVDPEDPDFVHEYVRALK